MLTLLLLVYGCSIILAVDKGPKLDEISYICHPSDASGYSEWTSWKLEVETREIERDNGHPDRRVISNLGSRISNLGSRISDP